MNQFTPKNWKEYSATLPWVCGLMTYNSELTIYETLRFATKMFDVILITDDGSTDQTQSETIRFLKDSQEINNCKIITLDVAKWDPLPHLKVAKDHGISSAPVSKTISKARMKNFFEAKKRYPHSIYFALEDDVIVDYTKKNLIREQISSWKEPLTDCEYFNVINMINKEWLRLSNPDPMGIMKRRKSYDNAGDWTFACWYTLGKNTVVPDPGFPYGPCLDPWLEKNQLGKKGKNCHPPFGYHFLYYRQNRIGFVLEDGTKRILELEKSEDNEINYDLVNEINFRRNMSMAIENGSATLRLK